MYSSFIQHWSLDPSVTFLNHGSFGATPKPVLAFQQALRLRMEAEPVRFMMQELQTHYLASLSALAKLLQAQAQDMVFLPNATHGVNAVLRSLRLQPEDEIVTTSHDYFAIRNTLEYVTHRCGGQLICASVPFPVSDEEEIVQAILDRVTDRTRLVLIDHITSPTAILFPVEKIVQRLQERGIDTLIDGAHGPGMVDLALEKIGAAYYTGNCHKWLCAPKGAAFLWVRKDKQAEMEPLVTSYRRSTPSSLSPFQLEFFWSGTGDPTAYLSVAEAIRFLETLLPGGLAELRRRNHELVVASRRHLCDRLQIEPPCPESMLTAMASLALPQASDCPSPLPAFYLDPLQRRLIKEFAIQVPIMIWPRPPYRLLRISCQIYNHLSQYELLGDALKQMWA